MSYSKAKKCFQQNVKEIGEAPIDTPEKLLIWNLSMGLTALTEALEQDVLEIRGALDLIFQRPVSRSLRDQ